MTPLLASLRMRLPILFGLILCQFLLASHAGAQEFKPYPRANITEAQWQKYFDEVQEKHGANVQEIEDQRLFVFTDKKTNTIYGFTRPGHPAHPAWITRKLEQREDELFIGQIGYFAGSEPPFAQLFDLALEFRIS